MPSFNIPRTERGKTYLKPFHGQVFTLEEIKKVIQNYGLPGDKWKTEELWRYDRFVEVQIWDDRPLKKFVPY
ncbi:MAG: hypothetical protein ACRC06_16220 [Waterburya sp.]